PLAATPPAPRSPGRRPRWPRSRTPHCAPRPPSWPRLPEATSPGYGRWTGRDRVVLARPGGRGRRGAAAGLAGASRGAGPGPPLPATPASPAGGGTSAPPKTDQYWTYAAEHVPENREVPTPSGKSALPANDATPGLNARQDLRWPSPRPRRGLRPDNRREQTRPRCTPRRWTSCRPGTCEATAGARLTGRFAARDARTVESAAM